MNINKKETKFILKQIEIVCESECISDDIYSFIESDYDELDQKDLNLMKELKKKLENNR